MRPWARRGLLGSFIEGVGLESLHYLAGGLAWHQGYGCAGASATSYGLIAREAERREGRDCRALASSLSNWTETTV